ncbi:4-deoxy-4-formamido-L-arabinose-phosphoundecaprenol deformylase [Shewanella surugensis]|uniref:Probable 4-deoxy-4-formamido-L-arabinose-phosphoundecaprenol deformylase ArnD n=1 Tax=Shewanella surugensis TaxID=212020 RepID=A0ABT0LHZ3_9GAMM|nr:4-deoxy-4-formamido-L-arabinose-phosphoundecaprenol deformylase [Shewanella surugensis]MCL1126927.1 4-deoxy-4-formamido-L-arabinose-phosphoundecaprenol deformylase [Shewanella surugensis]
MTNPAPIKVGLRIDVDTYRGTRLGVPQLLTLLSRYDILASFFFTVGPDNMGRHIWRLLRPKFLRKMLRSKAASLYGWDILLRGTLWPGPIIGKKLASIIQRTHQAHHEIGLHAWDHHKWQIHTNHMSASELHAEINKGYQLLSTLTQSQIHCSAVPGWRCNEATLEQKQRFGFRYNSDCRGQSIFIPQKNMAPQIPVTLPTYDELIGQQGITHDNYNTEIIKLIKPHQLNVYTIHAEVEGIICADLFEDLLLQAQQHNIEFVPLVDLLDKPDTQWPIDTILNLETPGREGWLSQQGSAVSCQSSK